MKLVACFWDLGTFSHDLQVKSLVTLFFFFYYSQYDDVIQDVDQHEKELINESTKVKVIPFGNFYVLDNDDDDGNLNSIHGQCIEPVMGKVVNKFQCCCMSTDHVADTGDGKCKCHNPGENQDKDLDKQQNPEIDKPYLQSVVPPYVSNGNQKELHKELSTEHSKLKITSNILSHSTPTVTSANDFSKGEKSNHKNAWKLDTGDIQDLSDQTCNIEQFPSVVSMQDTSKQSESNSSKSVAFRVPNTSGVNVSNSKQLKFPPIMHRRFAIVKNTVVPVVQTSNPHRSSMFPSPFDKNSSSHPSVSRCRKPIHNFPSKRVTNYPPISHNNNQRTEQKSSYLQMSTKSLEIPPRQNVLQISPANGGAMSYLSAMAKISSELDRQPNKRRKQREVGVRFDYLHKKQDLSPAALKQDAEQHISILKPTGHDFSNRGSEGLLISADVEECHFRGIIADDRAKQKHYQKRVSLVQNKYFNESHLVRFTDVDENMKRLVHKLRGMQANFLFSISDSIYYIGGVINSLHNLTSEIVDDYEDFSTEVDEVTYYRLRQVERNFNITDYYQRYVHVYYCIILLLVGPDRLKAC